MKLQWLKYKKNSNKSFKSLCANIKNNLFSLNLHEVKTSLKVRLQRCFKQFKKKSTLLLLCKCLCGKIMSNYRPPLLWPSGWQETSERLRLCQSQLVSVVSIFLFGIVAVMMQIAGAPLTLQVDRTGPSGWWRMQTQMSESVFMRQSLVHCFSFKVEKLVSCQVTAHFVHQGQSMIFIRGVLLGLLGSCYFFLLRSSMRYFSCLVRIS